MVWGAVSHSERAHANSNQPALCTSQASGSVSDGDGDGVPCNEDTPRWCSAIISPLVIPSIP
ncbi:hypothetical protein E2C01_042931 [Portunus trituberculatus]|uniref:Uncharacterized protein n=1 Tax=Portunus trituberculatus TaxID=210409 RepID=A0A5B7FUQ6_PORTR|nr:hypothetical protein [Portunus trituberculatus]